MAFEDQEVSEKLKARSAKPVAKMTLQKAIELGEYDPSFLANFPEWHILGRHVQFQYIKQALDNRHRQLIVQWAEINNMLDFSTKPHLQMALDNLTKQIKKLEKDRETLYVEYSK